MLNMQTKQNEAGAPVQFINDEHDGAEFNSMANELKNAILDQVETLTELGAYASEDIHTLSKAIIAGSGFIYTPSSQSDGNITFNGGQGASGNAQPSLVAIEGKIVSFISTFDSTNSIQVLTWSTFTTFLRNFDGTHVQKGQIKEGMLVSFYYNGTDSILVATVDPVVGGVFLKSIGFGKGLDTDWETKPANILQNRMGEYTSLQTTLSGFFYDVIGHGFRTETLLGSDIVESFNALPDTNLRGATVTYTSAGFIIGLGDTGIDSTQVAARRASDGSVVQIDIPVATQVAMASVNDITESVIFLTNSLSNCQIIRSKDNATTWDEVFTNISRVMTGITCFADGTIVGTQANVTGGVPRPIYSEDNGDTFLEPSNNIGTGKVITTVGGIHTVFMKHSDGTIYFACHGDTSSGFDWARLYKSNGLDSPWSIVSNIYNGVHGKEEVSCSYMDSADDAIYVGIHSSSTTDLVLRKTTDDGASWSTVYTAPSTESDYILKVLKTPDGIFYAIVRGVGVYSTRVIRSLDNWATWETISESSTLIGDMVFVPADSALYLIRSNSADSKGFIVETIEVEKEYATGSGTPIKQRFYNGVVDFFIGSISNIGDKVQWGLGVLSLAKNYIGILRNSDAPITPDQAPAGSLFRNIEANNKLYYKEIDGAIKAIGDESGRYIPEITSEYRINITTIRYAYWTRSGDDITVFGLHDGTPTSALPVSFKMSLPDATTFTSKGQVAGGVWDQDYASGHVYAGSPETAVNIALDNADLNLKAISYHFTYRSTV